MLLKNREFLALTDGECMREKAMLVNGELRYMDLLVKRSDGGYNIIDYKSSEHLSDLHVKQVRGYIKAVENITCKEVKGVLCYLRDDKILLKEIE
jgi:exodeoxyribonuclease V beta subunit